MQETFVWCLDREDPTCHGTTEHEHHNYRACALELGAAATEPRAATTEARVPWAHALQEKPPHWEACSLQLEKSPRSNKDPGQPNIDKKKKYFLKKEEENLCSC